MRLPTLRQAAKAGAIALLSWGLLCGLAWLALPGLIQSQLQTRLGALLGRPVTVAAVRVRPWALALEIDGLSLAGSAATRPGATGGAPSLELANLALSLSASSLWQRALVVDSLDIVGPQVRITRAADGRYDIDDIVRRLLALAAEPQAEAQPGLPRIVLRGLQLRDAGLRMDDRRAGATHLLEGLALSLPLLSTLPGDAQREVGPRFSGRINGRPFDSSLQGTPFAPLRQGLWRLKLDALDLAPAAAYLPPALPLRLANGLLSADLSVQLAQAADKAWTLAVSGSLELQKLLLKDPQGQPLLGWDRMQLAITRIEPLRQQVALQRLQIDNPVLSLRRDGAGQLAWPPSGAPEAARAPAAGAGDSAASTWQFSLAELELKDGRAGWRDASTSPAAELDLVELQLRASAMQWPATAPLSASLSGRLQRPAAAGAADLGKVALEGQVSPSAARLQLAVDGLALPALQPYLARWLLPTLSGTASAHGQLDWAATGEQAGLRLQLADASVDGLALAGAGLGWQSLRLRGVEVDLPRRRLKLAQLSLRQPQAALARDADGRLSFARWLRPAAADAPAPAAPAAPATAAGADPGWQIRLDDLALEGGKLDWRDALVYGPGGAPLALQFDGLALRLQGIDWPAVRGAVASPARFQGQLRVPASGGQPASSGSFAIDARLDLAGQALSSSLTLNHLPLADLVAYAPMPGHLRLASLQAGFQGKLAMRRAGQGWVIGLDGDTLLDDLLLQARTDPVAPLLQGEVIADGSELLRWRQLAGKGIRLRLAPGAKPDLALAELVLSDFFSRLVITDKGAFNVVDATQSAVPAPGAAGAAAAAPASAATADAAAALPLDIAIGLTKFVNGSIDFNDHFVRPNYRADLTALNGQIGAFNSANREQAAIVLSGKVAGTGQLQISGSLNPVVRPLALDIRAKADDLELAPLSPYAGKYAGYAIERGKLGMDVHYKIDGDGRLDASNQVVLHQLTFGDKVDSPDAISLPVRLAVALLKDRNGVIDINLPISGSLSDPQFSLGGLIFKVIVNLIGKVLTAPFALLGGGAGGDRLDMVEFVPGTALLAEGAQATLAKVASALLDRPSLLLTAAGSADPQTERLAYRRATLDARLARDRPGAPALAAAEREPLLAAIPADDAAMQELALQRGLAVREALIARGLPAARLFIAAPKLHLPAAEGAASAASAPAWTPRAQLTLTAP